MVRLAVKLFDPDSIFFGRSESTTKQIKMEEAKAK
jgi:hypothetical protein